MKDLRFYNLSKGDDINGMWKKERREKEMNNVEKLRNYFLGKDPQLKETMADNSLRLIGIEGKHFVLRTEMLKRLIELKKQVDDKDEELQGEVAC